MSDKVRLGIVGVGGVAQSHFNTLGANPEVEFAAVCDVREDAARETAAKYGGQVFTSARAMFDTVELDAAWLCLPPFAHGEAEFAAIEHKVPFFIEKPINRDLVQASEIARGVAEANLLTSVGYMNRYRAGINQLRDALQSDPAVLVLGGWIGGEPRGEAPIVKWWVQKTLSGGQFVEQVTHTADLVRYLCGEPAEVCAFAVTGRVSGVPNYTNDDAVAATIKFKAGAVANLHSCCASNAKGGVTLSVYAVNVAGELGGWEHSMAIFRPGQEPVNVPGEGNIFEIEQQAFIAAVKSGDRSLIRCDFADGLETLRLTLAVNESIDKGRVVEL
ncbi:MAG: Gfo/Idh/MocA family oxidoreductase [Armatimonadetes bacterium]|nr:Gfo/Idh/MocA family oxidoreductase [Armatimonadota bacterium]